MRKAHIVFLAVAVGILSLAGCTKSDNNINISSEQSSTVEQPANESSLQSENFEQSKEEQVSEPISEVSELNEDELKRLEEQRERITSKYGEDSDEANVIEEIFYQYPNLSDEQYDQIINIRAGRSEGYERPYEEMVIIKKVDESAPKLTLSDVKAIIAEHDDFQEILDELKKYNNIQMK